MLVRVTVYVGCLSGVINDDDSQMLVENRRFNLPHLYLAAPSGVTPVGISPRYLATEKEKDCSFMWYKNIVGRFFGLVTKHACGRQTDGQSYDS